MGNVIEIDNPIARARAVKARLWNPPNARHSSEVEIVSGSERRKRKAAIVRQQEELKRAEADFRRQAQFDDMFRALLEEHIRSKIIAHRLLDEEVGPLPQQMTAGQIIVAVAKHYNVTLIDLKSQRRTAVVVRPRQVAVYLCREYTLNSLPQIGRRLGGRDHTTILHAHRKIKWLLEDGTDDQLTADVSSIKEVLGVA